MTSPQTPSFAALPMYDWPEARLETDHEWHMIRDALRAQGIPAPESLTRRNADLPLWPNSVRDNEEGLSRYLDPATLPPEELDLQAVWRHPCLLLAQTCWGPLGQGLDKHVVVVGQPDYSRFEGGDGTRYSSAILMRRDQEVAHESLSSNMETGTVGNALPLLVYTRLAFNSTDSLSGYLALRQDLHALGLPLDGVFYKQLETGGHRASIYAVAEGRADVCAVDCRTWDLAKRFEEKAGRLRVVGWTGMRVGLPFVTAKERRKDEVDGIKRALVRVGAELSS